MPSAEHESPLELIHGDPELIGWLLIDLFQVRIPEFVEVRPHPTEVRELVPRTYHADGVVAFHDKDGRAVFGAVVEVQRSRVEGKLRTWKQYLSALEAQLRAQVALVVLCSGAVAAWYSCRIEPDAGSLRLHPHWVTPEHVPLRIDQEEVEAQPSAAVLSMLLHGGEPGIDEAFPALAATLQDLGAERALLYYDVVMAGLPLSARERWEDHVKTTPNGYTFRSELFRRAEAEGKAEGRAEGKAEGLAKGEARSVLAVLDARGLTVPAQVRERVLATTDLDTLDTWLRRAVTADSVEEALAQS